MRRNGEWELTRAAEGESDAGSGCDRLVSRYTLKRGIVLEVLVCHFFEFSGMLLYVPYDRMFECRHFELITAEISAAVEFLTTFRTQLTCRGTRKTSILV